MAQFIQARLLPGLLVDVSKGRQKLRLALLVMVVLLLAIVLARPQWGFGWEEVKQRGLDIVVAIDTSRSMLATDVAPNRLQRSRLESMALKQLCRTDRMGLVAFAGTAFLQCPLSLDDEAFRQSLEALDANIIPQGGTALAEAIRTALGAFKEKNDNHKILVIFTDGEDHEGDAAEAARDAAKEGMRIFTIGVGTPNGDLITVTDERGNRGYLKDEQGNVIKSALNEALLQEIAKIGNGFYLPMSGARTMDTLFERGLKPLPKGEFEGRARPVYFERYQWFLGAVLVLLLAEMFWPDSRQSPRSKPQAAKLAVFLTLGLLTTAGMQAASPPAQSGKMVVKPTDDAEERKSLRQNRRLQHQLEATEKKIAEREKKPRGDDDNASLYYNKGTLEYETENYEAAEKSLRRSLNTPDLGVQSRAYYNLGNTHYRMGENEQDQQKQLQSWQQATNFYIDALRLNPQDEDARHNLMVVSNRIAMMPPPPPDQNQNDKDKQDNKDNKEEKNKDDKSQQQNQQKDQQQKQDQQKDQQKQDEQQQQQQERDAKDDQKKDQEQEAANPGKPMQMTPQQARQLLDAMKAEEKTLIFAPPPTNRTDRRFKNW